ncbi:vacuolar protein sorting-associated protein 37C isoform X2 [Ambystoma mexicanum]
MLLALNRRLAEENLSFQPRLDTGRVLLQEKYEGLGQVVTQYRQKKTKLDAFVSAMDPKSLLPTLQEHLRIIEEESEEMAEKFLEGLIPLETFLEDFASKRRLSHQRRVRVEKLQELLKLQETTTQSNLQQSESQTQPFMQPGTGPLLVDPQTIPGLPGRRSTPPFPLPYSPSPPLTDQPVGPIAQGSLAPASFPGYQSSQIIQSSPQRTFPYGPPSAPGNSRPAVPSFSYPQPAVPSQAAGYPMPAYPQPVSSSYPYPPAGGPGYHQPGATGPGYPQHPPGAQPTHSLSSAGQTACPYPTPSQMQPYPRPPQPPYPQYPGPSPGFPQPSLPVGTGWARYPTGQ